jgi:SAM-dependent methyltransferase
MITLLIAIHLSSFSSSTGALPPYYETKPELFHPDCKAAYIIHNNFEPEQFCPDLLAEATGAHISSFFHCPTLPQRTCIERTPNDFIAPGSNQENFRHHPPSQNVRFNTKNSRFADFASLEARTDGDCVTCWRFSEEQLRWMRFLDFIERTANISFYKGPVRTAIDFGCGSGGFLAALADRGVLGLGFARNWGHLPYLETAAARGVIAMHMDFRNHVPMVSGAVDMVHCSWLMNILSTKVEITAILIEWDRLVRPGGYIVQHGFRNSDPNKFTELLGEIKRVARLLGWKELHWVVLSGVYKRLGFMYQKPLRRLEVPSPTPAPGRGSPGGAVKH